jgi:bile acid:Na+ symporter, BASS family
MRPAKLLVAPAPAPDLNPLLASLGFLGRHATPILAGSVFIGIAVPPLAAALRPHLPVWIFLLTVATLLRVEPVELLRQARRPLRLLLLLAWILLASPLLTAAIGHMLGLPRGLLEPLVLWSMSPPLAASSAFAFMVGLNGSLALLLMVAATFLMPLTVPPLALALIGLKLEIGVVELMTRLAVFVGGAAVVAAAARRLIGPERLARCSLEASGFAVITFVLFGIAIMDGVQATLRSAPGQMLAYTAFTFAATLGMQGVTTLVFLALGRMDALTAGLVAGNRNMAIVWANLGAAAPPEVGLYLAVIQLPIFILPAALRPLYRRAMRGRSPR